MGVSQQGVYFLGPAPPWRSPRFEKWHADARDLVERVMASPRSPSLDVLARRARHDGYVDEYVAKLESLPLHLAYACLFYKLSRPNAPSVLHDLADYAHDLLKINLYDSSALRSSTAEDAVTDADEERRQERRRAEDEELLPPLDYPDDDDPLYSIEESPESVFGHDAGSDEW